MSFFSISLDSQDIDQSVFKRDKSLAQLNEVSNSGEMGEDSPSTSSSYDKRSIPANNLNQMKPTDSQDEEGEEGEISESD